MGSGIPIRDTAIIVWPPTELGPLLPCAGQKLWTQRTDEVHALVGPGHDQVHCLSACLPVHFPSIAGHRLPTMSCHWSTDATIQACFLMYYSRACFPTRRFDDPLAPDPAALAKMQARMAGTEQVFDRPKTLRT